jgi:hypothetical protein
MTERTLDVAWWLVQAILRASEPDYPETIPPIVVASGAFQWRITVTREELPTLRRVTFDASTPGSPGRSTPEEQS